MSAVKLVLFIYTEYCMIILNFLIKIKKSHIPLDSTGAAPAVTIVRNPKNRFRIHWREFSLGWLTYDLIFPRKRWMSVSVVLLPQQPVLKPSS